MVLVQAPSIAGVPGWPLSDTLKVRAVDADGNPQPGVMVVWAVRQGEGSIVPTTDTTDAEGLSSAVWTLGPRAGLNQARATTLDDAAVDFHSTGDVFRVDRLSSGWKIGCGLVQGALWCWGNGVMVGGGPPPSVDTTWGSGGGGPALVDDTRDFVDLTTGWVSVCVADAQLAVWCAGNGQPQLTSVNGLPPMRQIDGSGSSYEGYFCGVAAGDSTAWCWSLAAPAEQVPNSPAFTALWVEATESRSTAPGFTACGLRPDSTAACWGAGPLGDGSTGSSASPVAVAGGHRFVELGLGNEFACGRTARSEVWCWGRDYTDWTAEPGPPDILLPAHVADGAYEIAVSDRFTELLGAGPHLIRWEGAGRDVASPQSTGLAGLPVVGFGDDNSAPCVRLVGGEVYCWANLWDASSSIPVYSFTPVQPVRRLP